MRLDRETRILIRDPKKRQAWIIYQAALQGRSVADFARDAGVKRQTIYRVFLHPYPRMEKIIADALGVTPQELFPERYDKDGLPNRRMGRPPKKAAGKTIKQGARARNGKESSRGRHDEAA